MVHSEIGPTIRAMFPVTSPLGIPKSPSFHSGLDLIAAANADSLYNFADSKTIINSDNMQKNASCEDNSMYTSMPVQLPPLAGKILTTKFIKIKNDCISHHSFATSGLQLLMAYQTAWRIDKAIYTEAGLLKKRAKTGPESASVSNWYSIETQESLEED